MAKKSLAIRSVSAVAILGLSFGASATGAFAQTADPARDPETASTIERSTGSLTIHKQGNPDGTLPATGLETPGAPGTPLDGAEFRVTPIILTGADGTQLTPGTNAWLAAAQGLTPQSIGTDGSNARLGTPLPTKKSGDNGTGVAEFPDLPIGAYLVEEIDSPDGYTPAADFIAFIPMTNNNPGQDGQDGQDGTTWNYDVHAYPKNYTKTPPEKEVTDANQNIGGIYEYDIKTKVREVTEGKRLAYYWIEDTLDIENLALPEGGINDAVTVTVNGDPVTRDTDYVLRYHADSGTFRVEFTAAGLKELTSGAEVNVNVKTTKKTDAEVVPNEAREYEPSDPTTDSGMDDEPGTPPPGEDPEPTEPVFTFSSGVQFTKVDEDREGLEGAEFQLFRSAPGVDSCDAVDPQAEDAVPVAGALNGVQTPVTTFTSDANGRVVITGLHVNDFENNAEVPENQRTVYCLFEMKAPEGKELLAEPLKFDLLQSGTQTVTRTITWLNPDGTVNRSEPKDYEVPNYELVSLTVGSNAGEVVNLEDTTPKLPLTGGAGIGILAAIGAALVALGAWYARRNSAKN